MPMPVPQPFCLTRAQMDQTPCLVFASPHSGQHLPQDMRPAAGLDPFSLNSASDVAVDQLVAIAPSLGVPLIAGLISRAYVDLNRSPHDLDPVMVADAAREQAAPVAVSAKVRAGYGVVPRLTGHGQALYDRPLSQAEVDLRLCQVHAPYHLALHDLMHSALASHGRAVLVDWHSMPGRATGGAGVDVVLGDRFGSACNPNLTRQLRSLFEGLGLRVALNHPYAGGYSTQVWGQPERGFEAIQIELSRKLYWDESRGQPSAGWSRCQSGLNQVIKALIASFSSVK